MGFSKKRVENCLGMEGWLMWEKLNEGAGVKCGKKLYEILKETIKMFYKIVCRKLVFPTSHYFFWKKNHNFISSFLILIVQILSFNHAHSCNNLCILKSRLFDLLNKTIYITKQKRTTLLLKTILKCTSYNSFFLFLNFYI